MRKHPPFIVIGLFLALLSPVSSILAQINTPPPIPTTPAPEEKHPKSIPLWPNGDPNAADPIDRLNAQPDFAAHIYSSFLRNLTVGTTNDPAKLATLKSFPPTFLLCSATDSPGMVDFTDQFFLALKHAGVPVEVHVFSEGGHGFGVRKWSKSVGVWPELFEGWLNDQGFLKKK
jgi:acetyl esterase/lipase